ncbi:hypothetical protein HOO68_03380 [Candidatus Gracilibacteria bacterium]|nr:hypothetical protein [Candidatus Gracilibacteria bacterium]
MAKKEEKKDEKKKKEKEKPSVTQKMLDDAPQSITVVVDGQSVVGDKKEFTSGSVGWNVTGKVVIGGVKCQVSANIIIVGSKNVKR